MLVNTFFCYAHKDAPLVDQLETYLRPLQKQGLINMWYDREITAGSEWKHEIDTHLNTAQLILLMVSPDFMNSDYADSVEIQQAITRHKRGDAIVIPVILRPTHWQGAPFSKLQVLPTSAKPVTSSDWRDFDEAFFDITGGIVKVLEMLTARNRWLDEGMIKYEAKRYTEALAALDQAIHLDSSYAGTYLCKGKILFSLERYQEAFDLYDLATKVIPNNTWIWHDKGLVLFKLGNNKEAIDALYRSLGIINGNTSDWYRKGSAVNDSLRFAEALGTLDRAIYLDRNCVDIYLLKGKMLLDLGRYQEAFDLYNQATEVFPNDTWIWHDKGLALFRLGYDEEAIVAFNHAIQIDPNNMWAWHHKAIALGHLAQQAHEKARQLGYKE